MSPAFQEDSLLLSLWGSPYSDNPMLTFTSVSLPKPIHGLGVLFFPTGRKSNFLSPARLKSLTTVMFPCLFRFMPIFLYLKSELLQTHNLQHSNMLHGMLHHTISITTTFCAIKKEIRDFPGDPVAKTLRSQCRDPEFNPWSRS